MHLFLKFIFGIKLYMFWTVPLSIIRSFSLYTQQWYMSAKLHDNIPLLCLQWKIPDDGQKNCPKNVEFYSKNKFEKLVHLVGFIIRMLNNAQFPVFRRTVSFPIVMWYCQYMDYKVSMVDEYRALVEW